MKQPNLLHYLLCRRDVVSIDHGQLYLQPASGKAVCSDWLSQHIDQLIREAVTQLRVTALDYESYSTGRYGEHRAGGITLQFYNRVTEDNSYAIFNVDLNRVRNTDNARAGTPLPEGQFRIGRKSHFYTFWKMSGLKMPPRLSSFHDYMGNLQKHVFTGQYTKGKRLDAASLRSLNITHRQLLDAFNIQDVPYKAQTILGQMPDRGHTVLPDKQMIETQPLRGLQPLRAAGEGCYGTSKQEDTGIRVNVIPMSTAIRPEDQSTDEWLSHYDSVQDLSCRAGIKLSEP